MATLSVYIMVQNDETRVRRALESVKDIADELVVIDGGSIDRTADACRQYTNKVIVHAFEGYARQRRFALTQVTGDWVLAIDADETLSPELHDAISSLLKRSDVSAYEFPRKNYVKPGVWIRFGGLYPDYQRRLFRRTKAQYGSVVHAGEVPFIDGTVQRIDLDILHDQIGNNIQYSMKKLLRFVRAEVRETTATKGFVYHFGRAIFGLFFIPVKSFIVQRGFRMGILGIRVAGSITLLRFLVDIGLAFKRRSS